MKLKFVVFRKLILFLVTCGLFLLLLGLGLILLYIVYEEQYHHIRPLIVIGRYPFAAECAELQRRSSKALEECSVKCFYYRLGTFINHPLH